MMYDARFADLGQQPLALADDVLIGPVSLAVRLCVISDFRSPSIIARIF